ncbi:MAG: hypothetical protein HC902_12705, partial [Calothrix sp. SM1_5_4]|nr:hypothetical protein [Calothrix sp. SM1_5_4]
MNESNGTIAAMGYSNKTIANDRPEFDRVDDAVTRFQDAAEDINKAVISYSRESNSLADLVTEKKLFYNFDVAEFQKRIEQNIKTCQNNQQSMQKELARAESILNNWTRPEPRTNASQIFGKMQSLAEDYSNKAGHLAKLSQEMQGVS